MTQLHFTLNLDDVLKLIDSSVKDDLSKNLLQNIFQNLMEEQRDQYIGVGKYNRDKKESALEMAITTENILLE